MEDQNYTIKDIARMAGVSAGTVDRVLHNRGDVSPKSKAKVQKVLDEIHYQPNVFAIGLAAKKKYSFLCLIPYYIEHDYWHSVVGGIERARQELRPFNVSIDYLCYHHGDEKSYQEACLSIKEKNVDAVLISPNFREETLALTAYLQENKIAYAFVDFNMEEAKALTYIGQDSYKSGYIAAKILMRNYSAGEGQEFFQAHPKALLGVVFNSRVYQLGEYLRHAGRSMKGLIGYDLLKANVDLLKSGDVHYLIGQRPGLQGYCGVKALCDHVVFKKSVEPVKYMPIDILIKENIDFYFEFV